MRGAIITYALIYADANRLSTQLLSIEFLGSTFCIIAREIFEDTVR